MYFRCRVANAFTEHMNSLWTDERNRLGVDTVRAKLIIKNCLTYTRTVFIEAIKNE